MLKPLKEFLIYEQKENAQKFEKIHQKGKSSYQAGGSRFKAARKINSRDLPKGRQEIRN